MRKILVCLTLIFVVTPFFLSFAANYYLQHQFINLFDSDIEFKQLDFEHGWFNSNARLDLKLDQQNLVIQTDNQIQHGPVIWRSLFSNPINSFALFKIDTRFELLNLQTDSPISDQPGSAVTWVDYLGNSNPQIQHPGLNLSIAQTRVFADLADVNSEIDSDGTINTRIKTNQLELSDQGQNLYLKKPELKISLDPALPFPQILDFNATNLSGRLASDYYQTGEINLSSQLTKSHNIYQLQSELATEQLNINQATISNLSAEFKLLNLDQDLIEFIAEHQDSITASIQNNQWLVLLKHFSDLLKLINDNQPQITFLLQGQSDQQPVKLDFSGQLLADDETDLNPFSLLENLKIKLETQLPKTLVAKFEQPQLLEFLESMLEKGLLIEEYQSYYASLDFENTKLSVNH